MPIYEYTCNVCNAEFEEIVFDDKDPQCSSCGSSDTQKLMSRPSNYSSNSSSDNMGDSTGYSPTPASSGCAGCSGGNCSTCK